jgi:hypothetical protein
MTALRLRRSRICSRFVTELTLSLSHRELVKNSLATEGEEWIRKTARAAAVPDTLPDRWTSAVSLTAWHSSV